MNLSSRNKKVAIARWHKIIEKEKKNIKNNANAICLKAAICGFLAGDGCVKIRKRHSFFHYEIRFYPDDLVMIQKYCYAIKYIYDKVPHVTKLKNLFQVSITFRTILEDLVEVASFGLKTWQPSAKLFLTQNAKAHWLRAFFSAEAYVGKNAIKIQTVNKKGMREVSKLLFDFGINHKRYKYIPKNLNYSPVEILMIFRKDARKLFYERIGFWHRKKTEALKKSLNL